MCECVYVSVCVSVCVSVSIFERERESESHLLAQNFRRLCMHAQICLCVCIQKCVCVCVRVSGGKVCTHVCSEVCACACACLNKQNKPRLCVRAQTFVCMYVQKLRRCACACANLKRNAAYVCAPRDV